MKLPRVILADDHTLLLEAFRELLEPRYDVVGTFSDGRALLKSAPLLNPDVVVMDIAMPLLNGLEAARQLKQQVPGVKIVFLTMNEDTDLAEEAMRIGASGYLLKSSAASELFQAIQAALRAKTYVTPQIARGMRETFIRNGGKPYEKTLTARQREFLQLLAEGRTMKETAHALNVTPRTVAWHKYRLMEMMELKTNADLVRFAIRNNIIAT